MNFETLSPYVIPRETHLESQENGLITKWHKPQVGSLWISNQTPHFLQLDKCLVLCFYNLCKLQPQTYQLPYLSLASSLKTSQRQTYNKQLPIFSEPLGGTTTLGHIFYKVLILQISSGQKFFYIKWKNNWDKHVFVCVCLGILRNRIFLIKVFKAKQ